MVISFYRPGDATDTTPTQLLHVQTKDLPKCQPRHVLTMDNCSIHKTTTIQKYLSNKNRSSMSKSSVQKTHPSNFDPLQQAVTKSLELALPSKCENIFKKLFGLTSSHFLPDCKVMPV